MVVCTLKFHIGRKLRLMGPFCTLHPNSLFLEYGQGHFSRFLISGSFYAPPTLKINKPIQQRTFPYVVYTLEMKLRNVCIFV